MKGRKIVSIKYNIIIGIKQQFKHKIWLLRPFIIYKKLITGTAKHKMGEKALPQNKNYRKKVDRKKENKVY